MPRDLDYIPPAPVPLTNPTLKVLHRLHALIESKDPSAVDLNVFDGRGPKCIYGWGLAKGILKDDYVREHLSASDLFSGSTAPKTRHRAIALKRLTDRIRNEEKKEIHDRACRALTNAV